MTPEQYQRVKDLFQLAIEQPAAERLAFIEAATVNDPSVRTEVLGLLNHHDPQKAEAEGNATSKTPRSVRSRSSSTGVHRGESHTLPTSLKLDATSAKTRRRRTSWYLLVPLLMLLTLGVGSWMYGTIQSRLTQSQAGQLVALRDAAVALAEQWSQEQRTRLKSFAKLPVVHKTSSTPDSSNVEDLNASVTALFSPSAVVLICDPTGQVLYGSSGDNQKSRRVEPMLLPWFAEAMQTKDVVVRITTAGEEGLLPEFIGLVGVEGADSQLRMVVVVREHAQQQRLAELLGNLRFGQTGDVYAVSSTGLAITLPRDIDPLIRQGWFTSSDDMKTQKIKLVDPGVDLATENATRPRDALPLTKAAAGVVSGRNEIDVTGYRNYSGQKVLGAWHGMPLLQLGIVVEVTAIEAYMPLQAVQHGFGLLLASLLMAGLAAIAWAKITLARQPTPKNLLGAYELLEPLASGGMGTVFRARHSLLKRPSAIKVIRSERLMDEDIARFDREVRVASQLHSPHTISIFDYGKDVRGQWYFAMELLDGMTLDKVVARYGPLSVPRVLYIWEQVCQSLQEAHQMGLVHRDIKPQNIMLSCRGGCPDFAVVFDFGLAKPIASDTSLFATGERVWVGTPMYMSPERIRDPRHSDLRSDLYATGVLAYFLLVGNEPFLSSDPAALFEQIVSVTPPPPSRDASKRVPEDVDELVLRCLEKAVERRPQSADELRASLEELLLKYPWSRNEATLWWQSATKA